MPAAAGLGRLGLLARPVLGGVFKFVGTEPRQVFSPSTGRVDRTAKRLAYEEAGVPAYWLVDPIVASVTVLELVGGVYQEIAVVVGASSFEATLPFTVLITPERLLDDLS